MAIQIGKYNSMALTGKPQASMPNLACMSFSAKAAALPEA
jgi:hypothetical protein